MDISIMKEEIEVRLNAHVKQIAAYNLMLERFCRNDLIQEPFGNKVLNITGDGDAENNVYTKFKAEDEHIGPGPFIDSLRLYNKGHKDVSAYEKDSGICGKPMRKRELKRT